MQTKFTRAVLGGLAGIAVLATAAPAFARDPDPKTGRAAAAKSTTAKGSQRYCIEQQYTGSRIARQTCKTQAEWAKEGVDIVKEAAKGSRR